jgi:hypothetical protein
MNNWTRSSFFLMLLLIGFVSTRADVPTPNSNRVRRQSRPNPIYMQIQPAESAGDAKLVIPRDILQQLRASLDDTDQQDAASVTSNGRQNSRTIIAGIFLSISLAFGGVWLMRSGATSGKLARTAAVITLIGASGVATGIALGNAGPPPLARSLTSKILTPELQWWGAYGKVTVEVVAEGDHITLVLPNMKEKRQ